MFPALDDTIVAVASAWRPSPIGIVRLSGVDAFAIAGQIGVAAPLHFPAFVETRVALSPEFSIPAVAHFFRAPRSYTGQDVVELHMPGNLPLIRELTARLIELGVRRALPGEFSARAFVNGKLDARQVDGVLGLIQSASEAASRQAARAATGREQARIHELGERLLDLIARIEAGIDFVDEEDVRFITRDEIASEIEALLAAIETPEDAALSRRRVRPHVALVGLPNAGKSSLFNALLGYSRAIVSPVIGTTRDVLSAEIDFAGQAAVLQDCAGLGASVEEIEIAAHLAAEATAEQADVVLWVHDADREWDAAEVNACGRVAEPRRILVLSKIDAATGAERPAPAFPARIRVSAATGEGLSDLQAAVAETLALAQPSPGPAETEKRDAVAALVRARTVAADGVGPDVAGPEMLALELRSAWSHLAGCGGADPIEAVLGRIFAQFCVGK